MYTNTNIHQIQAKIDSIVMLEICNEGYYEENNHNIHHPYLEENMVDEYDDYYHCSMRLSIVRILLLKARY